MMRLSLMALMDALLSHCCLSTLASPWNGGTALTIREGREYLEGKSDKGAGICRLPIIPYAAKVLL